MTQVFIFNGTNAQFPSAVFSDYVLAEQWIKKHALTGLLTAYPLNTAVYDWALDSGYFQVKEKYQAEPSFIAKFSSAYLEHWHFENGMVENS
ncbi:MAG TPA: hypothetical protein VK154_15865 [Chitinophagales bacterium]|nr:hypothetical protein [Chitinophagales bacterium]